MSHSEHRLVSLDFLSCDHPQSSHCGNKNGAQPVRPVLSPVLSTGGVEGWVRCSRNKQEHGRTSMPAAWTALRPYQTRGFNREKPSERF